MESHRKAAAFQSGTAFPQSSSTSDSAGTDDPSQPNISAPDAARLFAQRLNMMPPYDPSQPDRGRSSIRHALNTANLFILDLFPTEGAALLPLRDLLYALWDLDRGRSPPLFQFEKEPGRQGLRLSEEFLRALAAAAMSKAMETMKGEAAGQLVASRLTAMGYRVKGKAISGRQVAKWRQANMEQLSKPKSGPYRQALTWTKGFNPNNAIDFLLDLLLGLHPQDAPSSAAAATGIASARREVDFNALEHAQDFLQQQLMLARRYDPLQPDHGRMIITALLGGEIGFIGELLPNKPFVLLPLRQLLFALRDLDRGKSSPMFEHVRVPHSPGVPLSEELFRAIAAAAMTRNMELLERQLAARNIARRLKAMGYRKTIDWKQVIDWRENVMSRNPREPRALARYQLALELVRGWQPGAAVDVLLALLPGLRAPDAPKNP